MNIKNLSKIVVKIYSKECSGNSKIMEIVLSNLYEKYKEHLVITKEIVGKKINNNFKSIQEFPTIQIIYKNELFAQFKGLVAQKVLEEKINDIIKNEVENV